jgi:hypothetical protein
MGGVGVSFLFSIQTFFSLLFRVCQSRIWFDLSHVISVLLVTVFVLKLITSYVLLTENSINQIYIFVQSSSNVRYDSNRMVTP